MKPLTIFILLFINFQQLSFSQSYIDVKKAKAKKKLEKIKSKDSHLNIIIAETDSTLSYLVRDKSVQNLDMILFFDDKGKCYKEKNRLTCDSCCQKFINQILANKYYRWTEIDSTTYFSRSPYRIIFKTKLNEPFAYELYRSDLAGDAYREKVRKAPRSNE